MSRTDKHLIKRLVKDERLPTKDMHGRRLVNAGDPIDNQDYVTKKFLEDRIGEEVTQIGLAEDTDILDEAVDLAIKVKADDPTIPGAEFRIQFYWPYLNLVSAWRQFILIHNSATLPTATTVDTGTNGEIEAGVLRLKDSTKAWTPNAYQLTHDIVIFSDKRGGTPTHDYEAEIVLSRIISNTATEIFWAGTNGSQPHTLNGLTYYIVARGGNNHFYEKIKHIHVRDDRADDRLNVFDYTGGGGTIYVWVIFENVWGLSRTNNPAVSKAFGGVEATEMSVATVSEISTVIGEFTSGTITGALIRTASSGARIELDSTNGLRAYNSSALVSQIGVSGGDAGKIFTTFVIATSTNLGLYSKNATEQIIVDEASSRLAFVTTSVTRLAIVDSGINLFGSIAGAGLAVDGTTVIDSSGEVQDGALSSNVPLKNAANSFTSDQTLTTANVQFSAGYGIHSGTNSVRLEASSIDIYTASTKRYEFGTAFKVWLDGAIRTIATESIDHGSGAKNWLYY